VARDIQIGVAREITKKEIDTSQVYGMQILTILFSYESRYK
jgi:hypothetical protein